MEGERAGPRDFALAGESVCGNPAADLVERGLRRRRLQPGKCRVLPGARLSGTPVGIDPAGFYAAGPAHHMHRVSAGGGDRDVLSGVACVDLVFERRQKQTAFFENVHGDGARGPVFCRAERRLWFPVAYAGDVGD